MKHEQLENENPNKLGYLLSLAEDTCGSKINASSVELERVTSHYAMKHYMNCLRLNAFTTWVNFTAHS